jgi:hypothetical protein
MPIMYSNATENNMNNIFEIEARQDELDLMADAMEDVKAKLVQEELNRMNIAMNEVKAEMRLEAEQDLMRRAVFGPGVKVVSNVTGEKYLT